MDSSIKDPDPKDYYCIICKDQRIVFYKVNTGAPKRSFGPDPNFPDGHKMPLDEWLLQVDMENAFLWTDEANQCSCVERLRKQKEMDRILASSNLSPRFRQRRFDTIEFLNPDDFPKKYQEEVQNLVAGQRTAYQLVLDYCINYDRHSKRGEGFGLLGDVGTAKTHFLGAAVNYLTERGIQAVHFNTQDLFREIRSTFNLDSDGKPLKQVRESEILDLMRNCDFLSLDDVGTEKPTEWVQEKFYEILNYRYEYHKPTAFSTNNTLKELEGHLGKSYRRLVEPCLGRMAVIKGMSFDQLLVHKIKR